MRHIKGILTLTLIVILLAGGAFGIYTYIGSGNWDQRFADELDRFFGEENWTCVTEETKESIIYEKYYSSRHLPYGESVPGKFKNWDILVTDEQGDNSLWTITNHALKINHDNYGFLSSKRLSNKEAFVLELFDISCIIAGDEAKENILQKTLSEEEADCFRVEISYDGGNPKPKFYDQLWAEEWFTVKQITVENFLASSLYDFYLDIHLHDYRLEKLSDTQKKHVMDSFEIIKADLLETYGKNASFDLYFDAEHKAEYRNGTAVN